MKVKFQDYYGRYVTVHNNTASGNVYIEVAQTPSLNDVRFTKEKYCLVKTDITLNENQLRLLIATLNEALGD